MADYKLISTGYIYRNSDGACIPSDESNEDYQEYLEWLSNESNQPDAADDIPASSTEMAWNDVRSKRNRLLQECDWIILSDSPLTEQKKGEYLTYRQALRDIPQDYTDIEDIIWPTKP